MKLLYSPAEEVYEGYLDAVEELSSRIASKYFDFDSEVQELRNMDATLLHNPEDDVASFNYLYSQAQSYYNRACNILISLIQERRYWKNLSVVANKLYSRARSYLLTTEEIKNLRNQTLQEAQVNNKLSLLVSLQAVINGALSDIKDLIEITHTKIDALNNSITNMSRQQRVVESLIGLNYPVSPKNDNAIKRN